MSKNNETSKSPELKRSWFKELKGEFGKITWPTKDSLFRQSVLVTVVAIIIGFLVAGVDWVLEIGMKWIVG